MKKLMFVAALTASTLAFTGCKAKKADAPVVEKTETVTIAPDNAGESVTGFTQEQYMAACKQSMTEAQCECYVDFYKSIGLKVTELGDSAKVQAAMSDLSADKAMEMQKCIQ